MIIYHGSKVKIDKPIKGGSRPYNDYGAAFYLTTDLELAKIWACKNETLGLVNKYYVNDRDYKNLKILDLTDKSKYSILNWIAILVHFKELDYKTKYENEYALKWLSQYYIDITEYDVVIGYRADDKYFRFPIHFLTNQLSLEDLEEVYALGDLGIQYAFVSLRAINLLKFESVIECDEKYIGQYYKKIKEACNIYDILVNQHSNPDKTYILDLIRRDHE